MDDNLTIRLAFSEDIPVMVALLGELFTIEDDFTIDEQIQFHGLELLLQDSHSIVLVAEIPEGVVGMITLQRVISTATGTYVGTIEDVIVTQEYRGSGIGSKLLDAAIEEANSRGWGRLALGVDLRNTKAIDFYQQKGFITSHIGLMYNNVTKDEI
ncbi:GNAT family N-acetyltransferase [Sulfuricurvum sp.]|uniref:GNAT family N-acetyltransferase n=1 Tax=Sulfuricurvum sp. TaxID=2025608 RepID=UPI002638B7D0|nr:GNAT family N-acetyltransferase [Sulfuricurvum sp.]MDD2781820.1 GNAT family N-acetyltransferase [Sulfuricurvum sp.]